MAIEELDGLGTQTADEWITAGRPGYVGKGQRSRGADLDRTFGQGNWRVGYLWREQAISRDEALCLYEEAYYRFLLKRADVLDWLCLTASEVYDIEPRDVESGLDFHRQHARATHLQDIAVRRCLSRLGRRFEGDHLIQIRGRDSEGYVLNPGQVPFHERQNILGPNLSGWWQEGSVEDFWQSNKILQVRACVPEEILQPYMLQELSRCGPQPRAVAIFGGSFNPIHFGHLRIAQELLDVRGFARVLFVPNGNHYRKRELISETHRARMVELAIADEPRFELCGYELGRDRVVHTQQTLRYLMERFAKETVQLYLIRGSDIIRRMLRWRSLPDLVQVRIVVPVRPGGDPWGEFGQDEMFRRHCRQFRVMRREYEDSLSSTLVRERIAAGHSVEDLVPEAVKRYIAENGLYRRPGEFP